MLSGCEADDGSTAAPIRPFAFASPLEDSTNVPPLRSDQLQQQQRTRWNALKEYRDYCSFFGAAEEEEEESVGASANGEKMLSGNNTNTNNANNECGHTYDDRRPRQPFHQQKQAGVVATICGDHHNGPSLATQSSYYNSSSSNSNLYAQPLARHPQQQQQQPRGGSLCGKPMAHSSSSSSNNNTTTTTTNTNTNTNDNNSSSSSNNSNGSVLQTTLFHLHFTQPDVPIYIHYFIISPTCDARQQEKVFYFYFYFCSFCFIVRVKFSTFHFSVVFFSGTFLLLLRGATAPRGSVT